MPTTRKRVSRAGGRFRITREAVEAYKAGDHERLHMALRIRPWEPDPLQTDTPEPPRNDGTVWAEVWPEIYRLRLELEAAANAD